MQSMRLLLLVVLALALTGCWNANNEHLHLGDVSLGQQLIDLKAALDAEALTAAEYEAAKASLLKSADLCMGDDEDADE
jgi:hypothetical protein